MPRLTKRVVEAMPPNKSIWDSDLKGFGARRKEGSSISYILKYRHHHRQRLYTIGRHGSPWTTEQARKEAKRLIGEVAAGIDPAVSRKAREVGETVEDVYRIYKEQDVEARLKPRTIESYHRYFSKYALPEFGKMKMTEVNYRDVNRLHQRMHVTPAMANHVAKKLSRLFSWAEENGYTPEDFPNPCRRVKRYKEKQKERYLSEKEIANLFHFLERGESDGTVRPWLAAAIKLLLFTGARRNEIMHLKWSMVKLDDHQLHLPDSKTGEKIIHLNEPAIEVLRSMQSGKPDDFVFPGRTPGFPIANIGESWRRIRPLFGFHDVRLHDLRHTFASIGVSNGMSLAQIGKLLGHTQPKTTARYAHVDVRAVREGAEKIGLLLTMK